MGPVKGRSLPAKVVRGVLQVARILLARIPRGEKHRCAVCGHGVGRFLPFKGGWRAAPPLISALDGVGSDLDHFSCPWCGAHDRERHLFLYMRAAGLMGAISKMDVLHFAPEMHLSDAIAKAGPRSYRKADLYPGAADVERIDLMAISAEAESYDLVIANHVLEHVADDRVAIGEIRRVLRPGGYAILQTPFSEKLEHTWSDPGIDTDAARLQAYGQEDHVRLFGKDIFGRFAEAGLVPRIARHEDLLADFDAGRYGVNPREPFILFQRPTAV